MSHTGEHRERGPVQSVIAGQKNKSKLEGWQMENDIKQGWERKQDS